MFKKIANFLKSDKALFKLLLALMIFIPLYPKFPLLNIPKTYVAIRIEDILFAAVALFWVYKKQFKIFEYLKQPIYQAFILFWIIGGLSIISALLITHSITPHLGVLHWLRRIEYMTFFVVASTTITSLSQVKTILKAGLIVGLIVVVYGFGQEWLKFPVISTTNREFSKGLILLLSPEARVNSTFAGHYDLAVFLSIVLSFTASLFFVYKNFKSKLAIFLGSILSFALLGLTAARVSFVATLIALSLSLWLNQKKILVGVLIILALGMVAAVPDLRHRLVATITVNLLGGGGPKYVPAGPPPNLRKLSESSKAAILRESIQGATESGATISSVPADIAPGEPINYTELEVSRSFGIRFDVEWPRALRAFYKNPFLGTGYSSITIATDNDFLRSLGEVGILGTLALALIFIFIIKSMVKFIRQNISFEKSFTIGALCSLIAVLLTGIFIDVLEASKVASILWFILGVSWAVIRNFKDAE